MPLERRLPAAHLTTFGPIGGKLLHLREADRVVRPAMLRILRLQVRHNDAEGPAVRVARVAGRPL